jgi:transketolase
MNNLKKSKLRTKVIHNALMSIYFAESGHPGGVLSCIDILFYLFLREIKRFKNIENKNRLILSKGHSVPALYSVAKEFGYLTKNHLKNLRKINSKAQGHPTINTFKCIECNTGSLGQGLSYSVGLALGYKLKKFDKKIFCVVGDGEMQEGQVWESLMFASHYKLNNLCVFLDYNKMQSDDLNQNIMNIEPVEKKINSFGWNVCRINGHNFSEIDKSVNKFKNSSKPFFIIADTVKGNGISFMENKPLWHGSVKISKEEIKQVLNEIGTQKDGIKIL